MATGVENLKIYQMARKLELGVYEVTKIFPKDEQYRSVDQLRRSSSSVTNNIAESYYKQSIRERLHIIKDTVICEAEETRSNLRTCAEKRFANNRRLEALTDEYTEFMKAAHGYVRFLKAKLAN